MTFQSLQCLTRAARPLLELANGYTFEPVVVSGTLEVLKDDPRGVFYRMADAVQSN